MTIVKQGSLWVLYTKDKSRVLGKFRTKKAALKRERQINYFKRLTGNRRKGKSSPQKR